MLKSFHSVIDFHKDLRGRQPETEAELLGNAWAGAGKLPWPKMGKKMPLLPSTYRTLKHTQHTPHTNNTHNTHQGAERTSRDRVRMVAEWLIFVENIKKALLVLFYVSSELHPTAGNGDLKNSDLNKIEVHLFSLAVQDCSGGFIMPPKTWAPIILFCHP